MLVMDVEDIKMLIQKLGFEVFFKKLINSMEQTFKQWESFEKVPRVATHFSYGVIELMPASNEHYYAYKYVNGHPKNPLQNKLTVMATGQLARNDTGEPVLISEMTQLTALRTAATSALAAKYLANKESKVLALIGTGAQSEFQTLAFKTLFNLKEVRYFDIDPEAMKKYEANMQGLSITACKSAQEAIKGADMITTITADKRNQTILTKEMVHKGVFINGVGGDCPGKTELSKELVEACKVVTEYTPQTLIEGEIQQCDASIVHAELHEVIRGLKEGRTHIDELTLFDSVGFGIEDFVVLELVYKLAKEHGIGKELEMIPALNNPKNLFGALL